MPENTEKGWKNYQPSKGMIVWSFLGGVVATLIVGFAVFGWYTAGGANNLAENAAEEARTELASAICVERFMRDPNVSANLAELKEEGSWERDDYIEDGKWLTIARFDGPLNEAADLCAETLVDMKAPMAGDSTATSG